MNQLRKLAAVFRSRRRCVVAAVLVSCAVALLITVVRGIPAPCSQDEFSYLLGADTFASGRLTNQTHPMWQHFETFHVIHQPTYVSKYPPAQSLLLAVGHRLGHPIIGSCIATGLSIGALVWMLTAWLPRKYWRVAIVFCGLHPGFHRWGQSYWGGAIALIGASLLIGAYGRLSAKMEWRFAAIAGLGTVLLANSRPFEGAVLTATIGLALIWKLVRFPNWRPQRFLTRVILPGFAVIGIGVALMLSYNAAVTGHPLKLPYQIHESTYGWNPLFLWQSAGNPPDYRHWEMKRFFEADKTFTERMFPGFWSSVRVKCESALWITRFFLTDMRLIAMLGLPFLLRKPRFRELVVLTIPVFVAASLTPWEMTHYFAPAAPLLVVIFLAATIELWRRVRHDVTTRRVVAGVAVLLFVVSSGRIVERFEYPIHRRFANHRRDIDQFLKRADGRDLVLVRYSESDENYYGQEWVYNAADIDAAEVVWAREISPERRDDLIKYFHDRRVWVAYADVKEHPCLRRFLPDAQANAGEGTNPTSKRVSPVVAKHTR